MGYIFSKRETIMKRTLPFACSFLAAVLLVFPQQAKRALRLSASPIANGEAEKRILAVLDEMVKSRQTYLSVPTEDGMALRLLTQAVGARNVAEIGTSTGYSGLWFCLALQRTDGHLTTFELDHSRAAAARDHFKRAGVESRVTIVEGDAHEQVATLKTPIDVAFIDADKEGYL